MSLLETFFLITNLEAKCFHSEELVYNGLLSKEHCDDSSGN